MVLRVQGFAFPPCLGICPAEAGLFPMRPVPLVWPLHLEVIRASSIPLRSPLHLRNRQRLFGVRTLNSPSRNRLYLSAFLDRSQSQLYLL